MWNCLHRIHIEILRKIDFDLTVKSQYFVYIDVDIMPINFCLRKICRHDELVLIAAFNIRRYISLDHICERKEIKFC